MKKNCMYIGLALGISCIAFFLVLNTLFYRCTHLNMDVHLKRSIETAINSSSTIDFSEVTNFDWDTLYVFTPYSSPVEILKSDDIITFNSKFSIEQSDNIVMLGFVKGHYLITYVELPRHFVSNLPAISMRFSKDTAIFKVDATKIPGEENYLQKAIAF